MEKFFKKINVFLSYMLVFATVLLIFSTPSYVKAEHGIDLFSSNEIVENIKNMEMNLTSIIYVKNKKGEWQEYQRLHGDENRIWVGIDKVPENLKNAFIAIEDETFYEHSGINWRRTLGAIGNYFFKFDETEFGGSTITQQLIKNVTSDKGRNMTRKAREIVRAMLIESKLDKIQILEAYLNTISLGNGICGVQVASNYYFNKDVSELSLAECATIAAITKNPSRYNPVSGMDENILRRRVVLDKMLEWGMITDAEYDVAYNAEIVLDNSQKNHFEAEINSYFVDTLIDQVIADLSEKYNCSESLASTMFYNGGYKIYATVDLAIQEEMEKVYLNKQKYFKLMGEDLKGNKVNVQSAMTIMDYEGHIVGVVGGVGEKTVNRGLNRATDSPRQPGSTMKPIGVYALAIEKDLVHYTSKVLDKPIKNYYPDGKSGPKEWYGYYKGNITVDYAIRKSANTIPVRLLQDIGVDTSYDFLVNKLGCKHLTEADKNLSALALGGCNYGMTTTESAAAYAIFGNNGVFHKPTTYYKVVQGSKVILEPSKTGEQVISPATATIMNHLLQGVVYGSEGTGRGIASYNSMKAYAKTGTSSESNDLWMVAGTPYYVGSVWYGFDKQQEVKSTSAAATVWRDIMKQIHKGLEKKTFTDSEDVYKKGVGYYKNGTTPDNLISSSASETTSEQTSSTESTEQTTSSETTSSSDSTSSEGTTSSDTSSEGTESDTTSKPEEDGGETSKPENSEGEQGDQSDTPSKPSENEKPTPPQKPPEDENV